jgi:hypothetical protein
MELFDRLFGGGKMPGANKKNHFYQRDAVKEKLNQPIHIHFESYEPFLKMGKKTLPNPCTFMVTLSRPESSPCGLTCKVSGTNHKFRHHGVINGVIADVSMIRHSRVVGKRVVDGELKELKNLDGVYFMPGDTIFLNGMGEPYDSDNQPRETKEQQIFIEKERKQMTDSILNRGAA